MTSGRSALSRAGGLGGGFRGADGSAPFVTPFVWTISIFSGSTDFFGPVFAGTFFELGGACKYKHYTFTDFKHFAKLANEQATCASATSF